jgi:hypothetical protein
MSAESVKRRATCPDTQFGHAMAITLQDSLARMRWNDPSLWIWSPEPTHEPLVSKDDWTRAQSVVAAVKQRAPKPASRLYLLRGRVFCASCGRRMHGQTRGGARRYYRCAAHARYPGITDAHPRDVLVREQPIIDALEKWLDELFAPEHATQTARQIAAALAHGPDRTEHIDAARRRIVTAKREVERCRAALRDTNSPAARREVLTWLDEAAGEKEQAELALTAAMQLAPPSLSIEEIVAVVELRRPHRQSSANQPTKNAPHSTKRSESARSTTLNATRSDSGPTPLLQQRVGGRTFENDDWRVQPWWEIDDDARPT